MTTEQAFKKLVFSKDAVNRTSLTLCQRSQYRAYYNGKRSNRKPKDSTMQKYLFEYGYKLKPERWYL